MAKRASIREEQEGKVIDVVFMRCLGSSQRPRATLRGTEGRSIGEQHPASATCRDERAKLSQRLHCLSPATKAGELSRTT